MATILSPRPGVVFRFDAEVAPVTLLAEGMGPSLAAALTGVEAGLQAGVRFTNTLRQMVYAYTFGEKPAQLSLSGVLFSGNCQDPAGRHGLERMLGYYWAYGLPRRGAPIAVVVGQVVLEAFLVGGRFGINDPQTGLGAFTLDLRFFPDQA